MLTVKFVYDNEHDFAKFCAADLNGGKYRRNECYPEDINHECIHQIQQIECSIIGLILGIILVSYTHLYQTL